MPRSATKGRKAETIRTTSGFEARTFNRHRAVCFVSCWGGKVQYHYTYPTLADAERAAHNFASQVNTTAHAEAAEPV